MSILVIEDDLRVSSLIKRGLDEQGYHTEVANDGHVGKALALAEHYDLIITDIILPRISGLELCREIRSVQPGTPILMLTALGTTDEKIEGFDAGANDYMVKPFDIRELIVRVRELLKRRIPDAQAHNFILKYSDLELNRETKIVRRSGNEISLTPKELKLLEYMMLHHERVLTRAEIAEKVWDTHFDTGTNFIDVYINYLRKKIDKDYPTKLIHTRPGMGFVFKEDKLP